MTAAGKIGLVLVASWLWACSQKEPALQTPSVEREQAPTLSFQLVVAERIARLRASLPPAVSATEALAPERKAALQGLIGMAAGERGNMREAALEEALGFGAASLPELEAQLSDTTRPSEERVVVAELLGRHDLDAASQILLTQLELSRESWLRAHAAWNLAQTSSDHLLLRLILRLKYEVDGECVTQIARTLARWQSYAGLEALRELAQGPQTDWAELAVGALAHLAQEAGVANPGLLASRWRSARAGELAQLVPSQRLELVVWEAISALGQEHFQLRGVDDARFALARLESWAVPWLAEALLDQDPYIRLHVCQVLARMGERAQSAGPGLVSLLQDPRSGPAAAEALGAIRAPGARDALVPLLRPPTDLELRVACARSLGTLGDRAAVPALIFELRQPSPPPDLAATCAHSLVQLGEGGPAWPTLLLEFERAGADAASAELALENWLTAEAERFGAQAADLLKAWHELASDSQPSSAERRAARAALLRSRLLRVLG